MNETIKLNKIYNFDCLVGLKYVQDKSINVIATDLPYFGVLDVEWDNQWETLDDYLTFLDKVFIEFKRVLRDNGSLFIFSGRQYNRHIAILLDKYFKEERIIIWKRKRNMSTTRGKALNGEYKPLCYYSNIDKPVYNNIKVPPAKHLQNRKEYTTGILKDGVSLTDVWEINALPHNSKEKTNHESQKPLEIMERIINLSSNEHDIILDPFIGSGTTALACLKLNRQYIGFDTSKDYIEICNKRINDFYEKL